MDYLVSIIVPIYKSESYLKGCIESILRQTYQNIEIILVDDGSPDKCPQICDDYSKIDSRIYVIHQKNGGLSSARNAGIDASSGQFITFVDSDDIISPVMIEELVRIYEKERSDITGVYLTRIKDLDEYSEAIRGYHIYTPLCSINLIYDRVLKIISACGKLYVRSLFDEIRFPNGRYYEDEFVMPFIFLKANAVVMSDSNLYFYIQHNNDSILRGRLTRKKCDDALEMSRERIVFFKTLGDSKLVKKALKDHYYRLLTYLPQGRSYFEEEDFQTSLLAEKKRFEKDHPLLVSGIKSKNALYNIKVRLFGERK